MFCFYQSPTGSNGSWYKIPVELRQQIENDFEMVLLKNHYHLSSINWDEYKCMHPCNYMFKEIEVLKEKDVLSK